METSSTKSIKKALEIIRIGKGLSIRKQSILLEVDETAFFSFTTGVRNAPPSMLGAIIKVYPELSALVLKALADSHNELNGVKA